MKFFLLRFVDLLTKFIIAGFIALVILLATAVSLIRYYLPLVEDYHQDILQLVNDRVENFDVHAGIIRANIDSLTPEIELYDVRVTAKGHDEVIHVKELRLSVDLIKTLTSQRLSFERLFLSNLDLVLVQSDAKLWGLRTVANKSTSEPVKVRLLVEQLWAIRDLSVQNIRISLNSYDLPPIQFPVMAIEILTHGRTKKMQLTVEGETPQKPLAKLYARTRFSPYEKQFSFDSDMVLNELDVVELLPLLSSQYGLHDLKVSAKSKLSYEKEHVVMKGFFDVDHLSYQLDKAGLKVLELDDVDAEVYASLSKDTQSISFNNIAISQGSERVQLPNVQLEATPTQHNMYIDTVDTAQITAFARHLWRGVDSKLIGYINGLNLSGQLNNVYASVDNRQWGDFSLVAQSQSLNSDFYHNIPAIKNATGELALGAKQGEFTINSDGFGLHLEQVFAEGFKLDKVRGLIAWHIYPEENTVEQGEVEAESTVLNRLKLSGRDLEFKGGIGTADAEFILDLPLATFDDKSLFSPPTLSLQIGINDTQSDYIPQFLPLMLPLNLRDWLSNNIVQAKVSRADFIYHGVISKFSSLPKVIQLRLEADDTTINYLEGWPAIENIKGSLFLDDADIVAQLQSAKVLGIDIDNAEVKISKNNKGVSEVAIKAAYQATLAEAYKLLSIKPIAEPMSNALADWNVSGSNKVRGGIRVNLPLVKTKAGKKPDVDVVVSAKLRDASIKHTERDLAFENLNGRLYYSFKKGLSAKKLSFNFL
ncbi:MAG: hypothetical protein KAG18_05020, partial [Sinobacterium sp.]|nr:hypothetical protein [Sinobacterium sp.]